MRSDCAYGVICKLSPYCPNSGCGLECFMDMIKEDMEKFTNPKDQTLMHNLGNKYLQTWNARKTSKARGAATGRSFESWITNHLLSNGISYERGTMKFIFGTFQVDAIIPSREKPRVFLEMKINSDRQQALMFAGLINQLIDKEIKIGYVINVRKNMGKALLINHMDNFFVFPMDYTKGIKAIYRKIGKWSSKKEFDSEKQCDEFWKAYQERPT